MDDFPLLRGQHVPFPNMPLGGLMPGHGVQVRGGSSERALASQGQVISFGMVFGIS